MLEIRIEKFALDPLISIAIETCNCELSVEEPRRREVQEALIEFMMGNECVVGSERNEIETEHSVGDSESSDDDETETESEEKEGIKGGVECEDDDDDEVWDLEDGVQRPLSVAYSMTWKSMKGGLKPFREILSVALQSGHWKDCYQMVLRKPELLTLRSPYSPIMEALQMPEVPLKLIKVLDSGKADWMSQFGRGSRSILYFIHRDSSMEVLEYVLPKTIPYHRYRNKRVS
eukprot:TRINITY_DN585_c0_g2_i1.p1 TRINITY_DN585_c0_g2~~TRINITY_DN585_c0_g2_i1.p1  ORF type:complete len:259 (+),score=84.80 TRINITY_DN585_c0_g2_i1:82-777(+)